jgi:arginyl-tRNA synthetase
MVGTARETSRELGKLDGLTEAEAEDIAEMVGLGALKYFILKVDPRKNMTFNPKESIDFNGNTGPFIQYTHARIQSVLRKAEEQGLKAEATEETAAKLSDKELYLIRLIDSFPETVKDAAEGFSPAIIANYVYELAKEFNQFYHDYSILKEEDAALKSFRLLLAATTGKVLRTGMELLGVRVPDRM